MQLDQIPVTGLKGVGSKLAEKLRHLHLPARLVGVQFEQVLQILAGG